MVEVLRHIQEGCGVRKTARLTGHNRNTVARYSRLAGARAVFFCYRIQRPDHAAEKTKGDIPWTEEAGETKWYLYNLADASILEEPSEIAAFTRCQPDTPRHCAIEQETLSDIRAGIDKHIKNTELRKMNAPIGVKPTLKAWMELN